MYPSKYIIIPDTNILWNKEKDIVVNEDFSRFWKENASEFNLELAVPYVVKGELLFQQATSAKKHLETITESINKLNKIINKSQTFKLTENKIKKYVEDRFDKWLKSLKGTMINTPINGIDLKAIIELSIWREKPFKKLEQDKKDMNRLDDGGFRDAMILESVANFVENQSELSIAFICEDSTLRNAAKAKVGEKMNFSLHESLEDFSSYAKLLHENLEKEFVSQILSKAKSKFYSRGDEGCIWHRFKIREVISEQFPEKLKPEDGTSSPLSGLPGLFGLGGEQSSSWVPSQDFKWVIVRTVFILKTGAKEYNWSTVIRFEREFTRKGKEGLPDYPVGSLAKSLISGAIAEKNYPTRKDLCSDFVVAWKVDVSANKRFSKLKLIGVDFVSQEFLPKVIKPTDEE